MNKVKNVLIIDLLLVIAIVICWYAKSDYYAYIIKTIFKFILAIIVLLVVLVNMIREIKRNKIVYINKQKLDTKRRIEKMNRKR